MGAYLGHSAQDNKKKALSHNNCKMLGTSVLQSRPTTVYSGTCIFLSGQIFVVFMDN